MSTTTFWQQPTARTEQPILNTFTVVLGQGHLFLKALGQPMGNSILGQGIIRTTIYWDRVCFGPRGGLRQGQVLEGAEAHPYPFSRGVPPPPGGGCCLCLSPC